jgi:hypothetical protein
VNRIGVAQDRHKRRVLVNTVLMFSATQMVVRIDTVWYLGVSPEGSLDGTHWIGSVGSIAGLGTLGKRILQAVLETEVQSVSDGHFMCSFKE